jgi:hypothetical protein
MQPAGQEARSVPGTVILPLCSRANAGLGRHQNLERTHLLQASVEVFLLVVNGDLAVWSMVTDFTVPVLLGNIVGGTALFASRSE